MMLLPSAQWILKRRVDDGLLAVRSKLGNRVLSNTLMMRSGASEGATMLNAFDNALCAAGCGNWNLMRVSSIVPRGARLTQEQLKIPEGSVVPSVYACIHSSNSGETISAAIGVGLRRDAYGIIMEYSHKGTSVRAQEIVREMLEEAAGTRAIEFDEIVIISSEHEVEALACVFAGVFFWWQ